MKFSIAATLLAATSLVSAAEFRVVVGKAGNGTAALVFTPDQVKAKVGDQIHFEFYPKNHTVTQSSFAEPCTRQRNTVTNELGVDSGFMVVPANPKAVPVWTIEVQQDTSPIWMFCNQANHCNLGMVFAINAPESGNKTFAAFKEKARTATHPNPDDRITAPFTPPPSSSGTTTAAPSGDSPPAQSSAAASDSAPPPPAQTAKGAPTADQANAPAPSTSSRPSGALSALRVPGAGIALTLAGLLAGILL